MIYRFDGFELDMARYELRSGGQDIPLERQVFDVLAYLVANHERVVPKEELLDKIWGDRFVSEAALNSRVMAARKAIGDSGKEQRLIKTVHGRGYRFAGEIRTVSPADEQSAVRPPSAEKGIGQPLPAAAPSIQFARTSDGVNIAYWSMGAGKPLIVMPDWIWSHIRSELRLGDVVSWYRELAARWRVIRYDGRGEGLSDRVARDYTLRGRVLDLEAVVSQLGEPAALLAHVSSTLAAIAFAAEHPEQVSHLVLWCGYSRAEEFAGTTQMRALTSVLDHDWDLFVENIAHARATSWSTRVDRRGFTRYLREAASREYAEAAMQALSSLDVNEFLGRVMAPVLVVHCTGVAVPSIDASRRLAAAIPNAQLCIVEGIAPVPHLAAAENVVQLLEDFLGT